MQSAAPGGPSSSDTSTAALQPLEVKDLKWGYANGGRCIEGLLVNNTGNQYRYVSVSFALYDRDGTQVGTTMDNASNLDSEGRWSFKAQVLEDNVDRFELKGVSSN